MLVGSAGSTSLRLVIVALDASSGSVNVGVSSCGNPWIFLVSWSTTITINGLTVGVYFASAVSPFSSVARTLIPFASPLNPGFGINVTSPLVGLIRYVPCSGSSNSFPSTGVSPVGFNNLYPVIRTSGLETVNVGVPFCVFPRDPSEVLSSLVIVTSVTFGV